MSIDESLLLAYVDGELDAELRAHVEAALAGDPGLCEQVRAMRASQLPYQAAFGAQVVPEVPKTLRQHVDALSHLAAAPAAPARRAWLATAATAAAAFTTGLVSPWRPSFAPERPSEATVESAFADQPWVPAIATYHALYVRDTVARAADAPAALAALLEGFDAAQRQALFVPDLRSAGLEFRRVQRLGYEGRPLLQMVYLPAQGRPAALCALPVARADASVQSHALSGLSVAAWAHGGLAWVLAADWPLEETQTLAQRVAQRGFAELQAAS